MSITIESDLTRDAEEKEEPCLCAQMAPYWSDFYEDLDRSPRVRRDLRENADEKCHTCKGSGIEVVLQDIDFPSLNLSNESADRLFKMLGVESRSDDGFVGEMSIPEARRAVMRSQSRKSLEPFVKPEEKEYGKPREISPGVVELRPKRWHSRAINESMLRDYIDMFARFVIEVSRKGA